MPAATRGQRRISWSSLGDGAPLVLVPGLGSGSKLFGTLPRRFARAGLRCVTYDPVGVAPSSPHAGAWSFADAALDLVAVLDDAGLARVTLVGTSLGGKIALATANAAPDRVGRLALLASSATVTPRATRIYRFFELVATRLEPTEIGEAIAPFLFGSTLQSAKPELVADIVRATRPDAAARELMIAQTRALPGFSGADLARAVRCPTLVLAGTEDTLTTPDEARATAALIPGSELRMIANAGHSLLLESAETFAAVRDWCR